MPACFSLSFTVANRGRLIMLKNLPHQVPGTRAGGSGAAEGDPAGALRSPATYRHQPTGGSGARGRVGGRSLQEAKEWKHRHHCCVFPTALGAFTGCSVNRGSLSVHSHVYVLCLSLQPGPSLQPHPSLGPSPISWLSPCKLQSTGTVV